MKSVFVEVKNMNIECIWEHNGDDSILYSSNIIGAFTRGATKGEAIKKMPLEVAAYTKWMDGSVLLPSISDVEVIQEKASELNICDADSDVLFDTEKTALSADEYTRLKALALKSAKDFLALYEAFPDKNRSVLAARKTFYGDIPRTAEEMYQHTKNVNAYYFGEIGIEADNNGSILECRKRGFETLERQPNYLELGVFDGSYGELWSLKKVLRRFIWHDRIHAKAMYRMGIKTFGRSTIPDIFNFD